MAIDGRALEVVQSLYDAAIDESLWPSALRELTDLTGSQGASFWVLDHAEQIRLPGFIAINFDPAAIKAYLEHMVPLDPTNQYLAAHPDQAIVHDGLFITDREKDRHPYYAWHDKAVGTRYRMVGQMRPAPGIQSGIALHRMPSVGRYEPADLEQFAFLYGHLKRALAIAFRLGSLGAIKEAVMQVLDGNPAAIVLLDDQEGIVYANRSAEELGAGRDGVRLSLRQLALARKQDNDRFRGLVARASQETGAQPGVMRAARPSGKRPYAITVAPIAAKYPALVMLRPSVCVIIADPDSQRPIPGYRLRTLFGLTEAEAQLASLLANGEELRYAAEKLGVTYGTARARLAVIFEKTETRRQGELIRLLMTTCAI